MTRSKVNHWKVPGTCAQCHKEIAREFNESVHGEAVKAGVRDAPVCIDCHGEHLIMDPKSAGSPLNAQNVSAQTCGRCHGDPRLALRYDLPADRLPSYAGSYHGLALKEGKVTAANCASCHGVHSILRSSDPRSTVNAANLPKTCGACHKGVAEAKFTIGPVHVRTEARQESPGGEVDSLDVLGTDPGDAGLHAAAQLAGLAAQADPAAAAAGNPARKCCG